MLTQHGKTNDDEVKKNKININPKKNLSLSPSMIEGYKETMQETVNDPNKLISKMS